MILGLIREMFLLPELGIKPSSKTTFPGEPQSIPGRVELVVSMSTSVFALCTTSDTSDTGRTESKATTSWSLEELSATLPKVLHSRLCSSAHYSKGNNTVSFQAQTSRSRNANAEENRRKLFDEIVRLYKETVPGEADPAKAKKHEAV